MSEPAAWIVAATLLGLAVFVWLVVRVSRPDPGHHAIGQVADSQVWDAPTLAFIGADRLPAPSGQPAGHEPAAGEVGAGLQRETGGSASRSRAPAPAYGPCRCEGCKYEPTPAPLRDGLCPMCVADGCDPDALNAYLAAEFPPAPAYGSPPWWMQLAAESQAWMRRQDAEVAAFIAGLAVRA